MNRRPRPTTFVLAAALAVCATAAAGCGASSGGSGNTVRIARTGYFDPLAIGQADGSLTKAVRAAGATPKYTAPFGAFAPVAQALNSGAVDIGVGSITSAVGGLIGRSGYTIFAAQPPNTVDEGIVVPKSSPVRGIRDLVGKHVAVNKAGTGEYLLLKALASQGIARKQVKLQYLPPPQAAPAFASGKLDAWSTWGNFSDTARASNGGRMIATGGQIGSQNDIILVVRNGYLKAHPKVVEAIFRAARAESVKDRRDPAAATALGNRTAKLPAGVAALQTLAFRTQPPMQAVDPKVLSSFQQVADFFHGQDVLPAATKMTEHTIDVRHLGGPVR